MEIYKAGKESIEGDAYFHLSDLPPAPKPQESTAWIDGAVQALKDIKKTSEPTPIDMVRFRSNNLPVFRKYEVENNEQLAA